ncbi:MAG: hypothetical protein ACK559_21445, partial [bacterium]
MRVDARRTAQEHAAVAVRLAAGEPGRLVDPEARRPGEVRALDAGVHQRERGLVRADVQRVHLAGEADAEERVAAGDLLPALAHAREVGEARLHGADEGGEVGLPQRGDTVVVRPEDDVAEIALERERVVEHAHVALARLEAVGVMQPGERVG